MPGEILKPGRVGGIFSDRMNRVDRMVLVRPYRAGGMLVFLVTQGAALGFVSMALSGQGLLSW